MDDIFLRFFHWELGVLVAFCDLDMLLFNDMRLLQPLLLQMGSFRKFIVARNSQHNASPLRTTEVLTSRIGRQRHLLAHLGNPPPELIKKPPTGELLLDDSFFGTAHIRSKSEGNVQYK